VSFREPTVEDLKVSTMPSRIQYEFPPFIFHSDILSLTCNGSAVRLSEQSARVLATFLHHPGEVVSRNQLSHALWPEGDYTASEQGINNIISKLRISLRDDPKKPRYIETIPKRGYRFLVPVVSVSSGDAVPPDEIVAAPIAFEHEEGAALSTALAPASAQAGPPARALVASFRGAGRLLWVSAAVLLLLLGFLMFWLRHSQYTNSGTDKPITLAIAPFDVRENANPQFAESFRIDLIDALAGLPGIQVHAAHSIPAGQRVTAGADGRKLGVTAIVYTDFSKTGTLYNVEMELVRASDATHLYAWHYSGTIGQLKGIRELMLANLYSYWKGSGAAHQKEIGATRDAAAYELYLQAHYEAHLRTDDGMAAAVRDYRQAVARDPRFARAYAGLAFATFMSSETEDSYRNAENFALHSIALAPNLADGHAVLGNIYFRHDWRFAAGIREMHQASILNPDEPIYHMWLAFMLGDMGRFQEASDQLAVAQKDDPFWAPVYENEGNLGLISHDYERMRQASDTLAAIRPGSEEAYHLAAWAAWETGHYREAIADWRKFDLLEGAQERVAFEDRGFAALNSSGPKAYARLRLALAVQYEKQGVISNDFEVPEWAAFAGDRSLCLLELKKMIERREPASVQLAVNPAYDSLHHDPRFLDLVKQIGLPLPKGATTASAGN
jgi:DNA-binding winged helix-turn-helix (wHTH) protein/TolB-like protein/Flp pilus assembly protein TadD